MAQAAGALPEQRIPRQAIVQGAAGVVPQTSILCASITAGGRVGGDFARAIGSEVKALARVGGVTLLDRAVDAARAAGAQRIAVVGGAEVRAACASRIDAFIDESADGAENLCRALYAWEAETTLFMTSDLPFVNGDAIREFLARVPAGTLAIALSNESQYAAYFPKAPPHVTQIGAERVANGSVFVVPANAAQRVDRLARRLFEARKSLWRMAALLGPALLAGYAAQRLSIADLELRARRLLGVPALAVRDSSPALCYDVDSFEDYRYACERS